MAVTILVTGFGPFPGAPFNPTGPLVRAAGAAAAAGFGARDNHPAYFPDQLRGGRPRSAEADRTPQAGRAADVRAGAAGAHLRIETRARNALSLLPDAGGTAPRRLTIAAGGPAALAMPAPAHRLLAAVRATGVPAALSRDAGRYLCNYLCWRAAEAAGKSDGPRLAAFVHVPKVARRRGGRESAAG